MVNARSLVLMPSQEGRRQQIAAEINTQLANQAADPRPKDYPKTAEEWWRNVDAWWSELLEIINMFNTRLSDVPPLETGIMKSAGAALEEMRRTRNIELAKILDGAWSNAPDNGSIHGIPGWYILCDLCSESHVLYPEPPDKET